MEVIALLIVLVLVIAVVIIAFKVRKTKPSLIKSDTCLKGHEFEHYCASLLWDNGFDEVEVTRGSGDFGTDILAEKDGVTYAVQCKYYTSPVGVKAVQEAYAGRDYHDRMVGAVMTNQYFTGPAVEAAKKLKILLWDADYLGI